MRINTCTKKLSLSHAVRQMLGAATTSSVRVSRKLLHTVGGAGQTVYLPVVEDGQSEGLALCVSAQVRLEAK